MFHSRRRRFPLLLALLIATPACGGDDDGTDPSADATPSSDVDSGTGDPADASTSGGSANIDGQLHERELTPTTAYLTEVASVDVIVMPDGGSACTLEQPDGTLTATVGFPCGLPGADSTIPVAGTTSCGDIATAWVLVEGFDGEFAEYIAESGTVSIATASTDLVTGSFTAAFNEQDTLNGTFSAIVCGQRDGSRVSR